MGYTVGTGVATTDICTINKFAKLCLSYTFEKYIYRLHMVLALVKEIPKPGLEID